MVGDNLPPYRGTSLTKKRTPLGPYSRPMPRVPGWSWAGGCFLMSEVPLYAYSPAPSVYGNGKVSWCPS